MSFEDKESLSLVLKSYRLFFDGDIELRSDVITDFILKNGALPDNVYVDEITPDIREYNRFSSKKLEVKRELKPISTNWIIPEYYQSMDVINHIKSIPLKNDDLYSSRVKRRDDELKLFEKYGLMDILKVVIFIVDSFRKSKTIWGTGRGSSCSSYLFHIIGLHSVDVILYEIPISDFFKQEK